MKSQKGRKRTNRTRAKYFWPIGVLFGVLALSLIAYGKASLYRTASAPERTQPAKGSPVTFTDAHRQAAEFITYDRSIVLSHEQKKLMDEALSSIPAPCCAQFSMATCCCPCNLAKAAWGLSKFLIADHHYDAPQVKAAVAEWLQFTNPEGYSGDACFTRGCNRPFDQNGCGGMDEGRIQ